MRWLVLSALLWAVAGANGGGAPPGRPRLKIDVRLDREVGVASPLLYGCSLPAPGTPGARALLAELVRNGSFETPPPWRTLPLPKPWGSPPGWELRLGGNKRIVVRKTLGLKRSLFFVRGRPRQDYSLTVFARKIDGPGGLCVLAEVADRGNLVAWTLGAMDNRYHVLERVNRGALTQVGLPVPGRIDTCRTYRIDLEKRGRTLACFLDGRLIQAAYGLPRRRTGFGLGPANATAEYFDLVVHDSKERLLYALDDKMEGRRPTIAAEWQELRGPKNQVYYRWDTLYPANSYFSQRLEVNRYAEGDAGICQRGIPLVAGAAYRGRLHLRADSRVAAQVSLRSRDGRVYTRHDLPNLAESWTPYDFAFKAPAADPDAELCVSVNAVARARVDRVSLVRADAPAAYGLRGEVVAALRALKPSVLRWPAGAASLHHNWQRGIGPRDRRPVVSVAPGAADALVAAPADFGTNEFLTLCRDLGAEPILVVNPVLGMRPALYWLEYCNGGAATRWGKLRAAHGHPEPYAVRYWAIDAAWRDRVKQDLYLETTAKIATAMKEQDPAIRLIIPGAAAMGHAALDDSLRADAAGSLSHIARSARVAAAGTDGATSVAELEAGLKSLSHKDFRIALTDWSPAPSAAGASLTAARALNVLARAAGPEALATCVAATPAAAVPLGRHLAAAPAAGGAPSATFEVLRLFRSHAIRQRVSAQARLTADEGEGGEPPVDVVAGRCGESAVVRVVHHGDRPLGAELAFAGLGTRRLAGEAQVWRIDGKDGAKPRAERTTAAPAGARFALTLQPTSVYLIVVNLEGG